MSFFFEYLKFDERNLITGAILVVPLVYVIYKSYLSSSSPSTTISSDSPTSSTSEEKPKTIMQPARTDLLPPKDDLFTLEELKAYDGSTEGKPIYVAIKGVVFDVSHKNDVYGAGKSYNIFAGKDGSKGLGMSSLSPEHAVADYSGLAADDMKVLDDWHTFFLKRYNVVGRVSDLPDSVKNHEVPNVPPASL